MNLLITGASGFLGKYVVAEALRRGHHVRAVVRSTNYGNSLPWCNDPAVELVCLDLRKGDGIADTLKGVDVVLHLAAVKEGDFDKQYAGTVVATENLLNAMVKANVLRLVAVSTFSVYDYFNIPSGETIAEDSPIELNPKQRDVYAQTKLIQEKIVRDFAENQLAQVTILRPGMIYGREHLWHVLLGAKITKNLWLRIDGKAQMPLTYVENCAEAIVTAVECEEGISQTINIVDDNLPSQKVYINKLTERKANIPRTLPLSWQILRLIAQIIWLGNKLLFKEQLKLPGILVPARLDARFKPFRYSNLRSQQILKWKPKYSLETALDRSCSDIDLLKVSDRQPSVSSGQ
jgi:nucleoside-diphosphate-sugar epimerase